MKTKKTSNEIEATIYDGYFQGHKCCLPPDKLSAYEIKCGPIRKFILKLTSVNMRDVRALRLYRSYAALNAEKYRQFKYYPFSIHPFSILRTTLEMILGVSMLISALVLAVHYSQFISEATCCWTIIVLDIKYVVLIIANFFTGYVEGDSSQKVILDLKKVSCKYAKFWLYIDIISTCSLVSKWVKGPEVVVYLVLDTMKIFRLPVLFTFVNNTLTVFRAGIITKTAVELTLSLYTYIAWNIYFQFAVEYMTEGSFAPINPRNCSWMTVAKLWNSSSTSRFVYAFDRAAVELTLSLYTYIAWNIYFQFAVEYMTEGSFAPINPRNCSWMTVAKLWNSSSTSRFVYAFDRAVGMLRQYANLNLIKREGCYQNFLIVGWCIGKVLTIHCALKYIIALIESESARAKYLMMSQQIRAYMEQRKFPPRIKKKILKFYAIRFQSNFFVESRMMASVSGQLKEDIILYTGRQLVGDVPFLKQLPRQLLLQIADKLKVVIYIAGDVIFKINTVGDCLYFIDKGTVAVYSVFGKEICVLEDGDFFGEIALVTRHRLRTASVVAVTNCELFRLDKEDFERSIACYPMAYEEIKKVATSRFERTCVLNDHEQTEMKMAKQ